MGDEGGFLLQFRILGPLEVLRAGECLPFRGSRERALVALLVLNANRIVSTERLAEDLWSGDPPEGAIRSLRVYVSRLRQTLGVAGEAVVTRPSGYGLQVDPEAVDALRFEALVARGRDKAKAGDHTGAAATLREALGLWRGPALADVADAPFAQAESNRLEEARLAALEDRIEADLTCGGHGEVTAELEALTGEHPFRERLWSQRMVALYRSGRQADALRAYQELRSTLREQLGIDPSSALQQLEGAVLRHDPELDWHRGPAAAPGSGKEAAETVLSVATAGPGRLPQPLRREEGLPLVGRETELSRLDEIEEAARSGQRHLVLLAGEPGIGKSRLAAEFARTAHGGGALVLFGRCDEDMGVPYQPFVEALGRYLRQAPELVLGRLASELVRLVPEVGERVHGLAPPLRSDPETERYRLFDAVAAWLGAVSASVPVVFIIEDLHWATKPTLLLLSHLLRSGENLRLLLLVTFRDTPLDMTADLADLLAELLRLPGVERVRLAGLSESGVGTLMEAQAGHALDDDGWTLARIVHGGTAGNPFYVREMLRHLAEQGDIVRRDGRWVAGQPLAELDVPDSVRDVVERRLTRLPDRTSERLALAAVLGERFDLAVLAEASGEPESSVGESLGPAVGARLVEETDAGSYHFTHALVRSTLEDALGPTRRLQLHRAAGLAVEAVHAGRLDRHLPQLAHHFAQARDVDKAIDYASRAGDRALAQLAHDEAAAYYRQALELVDLAGRPDDEAGRCGLLIALGEAQRRAGDAGHRQTLIDAAHLARKLGDPDALARAALTNTRGHIYSAAFVVDAERVAVLEAALAAAPEGDVATRARLLANLGMELAWESDPTRRLALSDEALHLARFIGDTETLAHVLLARDYTITGPENAAERLGASAEVLATAERLGDPVLTSRALILRFKAAMELADVAEAERCLARNQELVPDLGQATLSWAAMHHDATLRVLHGDTDAEAAINAAHEFGVASGWTDIVYFSGGQQVSLYLDQGRLGEVEALLGQLTERTGHPMVKGVYAFILSETGQMEDAARLFDELAATGFAHPTNTVTWLRFAADCAWLCSRLGRTDCVPELRSRLAPYADQLVVISLGGVVSGSVAFYLGLLATTIGDWRQAGASFAAAATTHERIGAPTWLARTRLEWARMLLTRGQSADAARARDLLEQALGAVRNLGLGSVERQVFELLKLMEKQAGGVTPGPKARDSSAL